MGTRYQRILLKLSGETLQDPERGCGINAAQAATVARRIRSVHEAGTAVAVVVGGGNIVRGRPDSSGGFSRHAGDYMGMVATIVNALALQDALEREGAPVQVMSALDIGKVAEPFTLRAARAHLAAGRIVVFAAGTGNPFFSTDTAAALRACEIGADALLKATKVDGVYSDDPRTNPDATRFERLTYQDALQRSLQVMDASAFSLCMENRIPIIVFNFFHENSIERAAAGEPIGTLVSE